MVGGRIAISAGHVDGPRHLRRGARRRCERDKLAPFLGGHAHKALALGLKLRVDALVTEPSYGAVMVVAQPAADPVPALRAAAEGIRLLGIGK